MSIGMIALPISSMGHDYHLGMNNHDLNKNERAKKRLPFTLR